MSKENERKEAEREKSHSSIDMSREEEQLKFLENMEIVKDLS